MEESEAVRVSTTESSRTFQSELGSSCVVALLQAWALGD